MARIPATQLVAKTTSAMFSLPRLESVYSMMSSSL